MSGGRGKRLREAASLFAFPSFAAERIRSQMTIILVICLIEKLCASVPSFENYFRFPSTLSSLLLSHLIPLSLVGLMAPALLLLLLPFPCGAQVPNPARPWERCSPHRRGISATLGARACVCAIERQQRKIAISSSARVSRTHVRAQAPVPFALITGRLLRESRL